VFADLATETGRDGKTQGTRGREILLPPGLRVLFRSISSMLAGMRGRLKMYAARRNRKIGH
jgi:hypothetical protein